MRKILLIIKIMCIIHLSYCQTNDTNCVRVCESSKILKRIPPEICLPKGYGFNYIKIPTDMNGDGLKDLIIDWSKYPVSDGDTIFYSVYKQSKNGKYSLLKTFKNLETIFFHKYYGTSPVFKNKKIDSLYHWTCKRSSELKFDKGIISIKFETEKDIKIINTYIYDKKRNNWYLINQKEIDVSGAENVILRSEKPNPEQSIDQFNYCDYL